MTRLGVNIDHVATVRQARRADEPDPVWAAVEAELGGADCITFHLREDRRHISDRDAEVLRRTVGVKLNMEMSIAAEIVDFARKLRPSQVTLVPERREELTTEGGLDVKKYKKQVAEVVRTLKGEGIEVNAFIEPKPELLEACEKCGFDGVEFWTGAFAHAAQDHALGEALEALAEAGAACLEAGMRALAGHGLTYRNVALLVRTFPFDELNIGHSIVSRSMFVGMRAAVQEMKGLIDRATDHAMIRAITMRSMLDPDDDLFDDDEFDDDELLGEEEEDKR